MEPLSHARHCDKCNMQVTDFTHMSDEEIIQFLNNGKGKVCGRLKES